jgi:SAM-dependent methyltransferase
MKYLQKTMKYLQKEGMGGLIRRLRSRLNGNNGMEAQKLEMETENAQKTYQEQVETFSHYAASTNFPGIENFYWYHSVELENGIVTPGDYDYRNSLNGFHFPDNMIGMKVLDVGSATGFFAFEFERRGANVVSVELPSLTEWDMIHDEKENTLKNMMYFHKVTTPEDAFYCHLDGPFKFCRAQKKSSIKRIYSSIYDLASHLREDDTFDIIFLGDILLHLFSPFRALNVIAPFCKSKLIVATDIFGTHAELPLMEFMGIKSKGKDAGTWWMFNDKCIEEMLLRVGFREVNIMGEYSGIMRRTWLKYRRYVFHATK